MSIWSFGGKERRREPRPAPVTTVGDVTPTVVGLTGAFGSGCTTAAKHLRDARGYKLVSLSSAIRARWTMEHGNVTATRLDLQKLGDQMREEGGSGVLVTEALKAISNESAIVVDGIRNLGEVRELEERFGYHFVLMGIMATAQERWDRIGQTYTDTARTRVDFLQDDERDRNEETNTGQQVELCVDRSDVFVNNSDDVSIGRFKEKIVEFVDLISGKQPRHANQDEIRMNMAYGASHSSKCVKRHVGAIVVDGAGQAIAIGYNENPLGTHPCVEEPEYDCKCYRDIVRNDHFKSLADRGTRCPGCGEPITFEPGPPWRCGSCAKKDPPVKTNLEAIFFPDRALNWCTAIHAEVWAMFVAGDRTKGGTLYTTTFPCFQCSEKIIQAGIKEVVYTEAYPDVKGELRLKLGSVKMRRFEGVRSSSFQRIFDAVRPR